jgi:hypothetical protein
MSKTLKIVLAGLIILVLGAGLVYTGIWIGRYGLNPFTTRWNTPGWEMMSGRHGGYCGRSNYPGGYGMMGGIYDQDSVAEPLSIHEIEDILEAYLEEVANPDLVLSEIMIFDNHAYAQILEKSTGIGAMEVLVDYKTKGVYPEQGPNMMWNLKYGHMAGSGTFRGPGMMMGSGAAQTFQDVDLENFDDMPISVPDALSAAQEYLDRYSPGYQADDHAVMFYGYYTLHVLDSDDVTGMLSVHGFSGQVFFHNWHGELLETDEH